MSKATAWVAEIDLHPINNVGRRVRIIAETQAELTEAVSAHYTSNGLSVGRNCYAPIIREETTIRIETQEPHHG